MSFWGYCSPSDIERADGLFRRALKDIDACAAHLAEARFEPSAETNAIRELASVVADYRRRTSC